MSCMKLRFASKFNQLGNNNNLHTKNNNIGVTIWHKEFERKSINYKSVITIQSNRSALNTSPIILSSSLLLNQQALYHTQKLITTQRRQYTTPQIESNDNTSKEKTPQKQITNPEITHEEPKFKIDIKEAYRVVKEGYHKLMQAHQKSKDIESKKMESWENYHFIETHDKNIKKLLPFLLGLIFYTVVPFSLLTLPLAVVYAPHIIPSHFLTPFWKRKVAIKLSQPCYNKISQSALLTSNFPFKFDETGFLLPDELKRMLTTLEDPIKNLRFISTIRIHFATDFNGFYKDVITEDRLLRLKTSSISEDELIAVCAKRKLLLKNPRTNQLLSAPQLKTLLYEWLKSTQKFPDELTSIDMDTIDQIAAFSWPIFLSAINNFSVPELIESSDKKGPYSFLYYETSTCVLPVNPMSVKIEVST